MNQMMKPAGVMEIQTLKIQVILVEVEEMMTVHKIKLPHQILKMIQAQPIKMTRMMVVWILIFHKVEVALIDLVVDLAKVIPVLGTKTNQLIEMMLEMSMKQLLQR